MNIFNVASSAMTAQTQRLNVSPSNLANADTVAGPDGSPTGAHRSCSRPMRPRPARTSAASGSRGVIEDQSPRKRSYDPKHPRADADGYVTYSNVNVVEEMVNMISASRSYQNNLEVMNTAKTLLLKTLQLGQ